MHQNIESTQQRSKLEVEYNEACKENEGLIEAEKRMNRLHKRLDLISRNVTHVKRKLVVILNIKSLQKLYQLIQTKQKMNAFRRLTSGRDDLTRKRLGLAKICMVVRAVKEGVFRAMRSKELKSNLRDGLLCLQYREGKRDNFILRKGFAALKTHRETRNRAKRLIVRAAQSLLPLQRTNLRKVLQGLVRENKTVKYFARKKALKLNILTLRKNIRERALTSRKVDQRMCLISLDQLMTRKQRLIEAFQAFKVGCYVAKKERLGTPLFSLNSKLGLFAKQIECLTHLEALIKKGSKRAFFAKLSQSGYREKKIGLVKELMRLELITKVKDKELRDSQEVTDFRSGCTKLWALFKYKKTMNLCLFVTMLINRRRVESADRLIGLRKLQSLFRTSKYNSFQALRTGILDAHFEKKSMRSDNLESRRLQNSQRIDELEQMRAQLKELSTKKALTSLIALVSKNKFKKALMAFGTLNVFGQTKRTIIGQIFYKLSIHSNKSIQKGLRMGMKALRYRVKVRKGLDSFSKIFDWKDKTRYVKGFSSIQRAAFHNQASVARGSTLLEAFIKNKTFFWKSQAFLSTSDFLLRITKASIEDSEARLVTQSQHYEGLKERQKDLTAKIDIYQSRAKLLSVSDKLNILHIKDKRNAFRDFVKATRTRPVLQNIEILAEKLRAVFSLQLQNAVEQIRQSERTRTVCTISVKHQASLQNLVSLEAEVAADYQKFSSNLNELNLQKASADEKRIESSSKINKMIPRAAQSISFYKAKNAFFYLKLRVLANKQLIDSFKSKSRKKMQKRLFGVLSLNRRLASLHRVEKRVKSLQNDNFLASFASVKNFALRQKLGDATWRMIDAAKRAKVGSSLKQRVNEMGQEGFLRLQRDSSNRRVFNALKTIWRRNRDQRRLEARVTNEYQHRLVRRSFMRLKINKFVEKSKNSSKTLESQTCGSLGSISQKNEIIDIPRSFLVDENQIYCPILNRLHSLAARSLRGGLFGIKQRAEAIYLHKSKAAFRILSRIEFKKNLVSKSSFLRAISSKSFDKGSHELIEKFVKSKAKHRLLRVFKEWFSLVHISKKIESKDPSSSLLLTKMMMTRSKQAKSLVYNFQRSSDSGDSSRKNLLPISPYKTTPAPRRIRLMRNGLDGLKIFAKNRKFIKSRLRAEYPALRSLKDHANEELHLLMLDSKEDLIREIREVEDLNKKVKGFKSTLEELNEIEQAERRRHFEVILRGSVSTLALILNKILSSRKRRVLEEIKLSRSQEFESIFDHRIALRTIGRKGKDLVRERGLLQNDIDNYTDKIRQSSKQFVDIQK